LKEYFIKKIKIQGPISISEYMAESLLAPRVGYYDSKIAIGKKGDFITGPEISQMFGELIGVFYTECWKINDKPLPIQFVDMGGGNGTMMKDSLRVIKNLAPILFENINPIFVENSSLLIKNQKKLIPNSICINDVDLIPQGNLFLTANEFFDCLPIHQFIKINGRWHERLVGLDENDQMVFVSGTKPTKYESILPKLYKDGEIYELSTTIINTINSLSNRVNDCRGIILIIDYAYKGKEPFGTLQAVKNHKMINPLSNPASSDLSCRVNFDLISATAKDAGAIVYGPITQKIFLERLGISIRSRKLVKNNPDKKKNINDAKNRLIAEGGMGDLFKVMAITSKNFKIPEIFLELK